MFYIRLYRVFPLCDIVITYTKMRIAKLDGIGSHDKGILATRCTTIKARDEHIEIGQGIPFVSLHIQEELIGLDMREDQIAIHRRFEVEQWGADTLSCDQGILMMVADKYPIEPYHARKADGYLIYMYIDIVVRVDTLHYP